MKNYYLILLALIGCFIVPSLAHATISAVGVLGQGNFTSSTANWPTGSTNAQGFNHVSSNALDPVNHRLFVSDVDNTRILVFPLSNTNTITTTTPSYVLGECTFTSSTIIATPSSSTFSGTPPVNLAYGSSSNLLFVSDAIWNRVLAFNVATSTISNCEGASFVIGQSNFTQTSTATTQNGLFNPDDIAYDPVNGRLFVSDSHNVRVMAFPVPANATSGINGENATFVLGQPNFTSQNINQFTSSTFWGSIAGEAYDSVNARLFVSDLQNNRVLIFSVPANATSGINGEGAMNVIGQPNFTHRFANVTSTSLTASPDDLTYDNTAGRLFVSNTQVNSITVFDASTSTITNGEAAEGLMSQLNFASSTAGFTSSTLLNTGEADGDFDPQNNVLYVHDASNRVLQFSMIQITTPSLPNGTVGSSYSQTITVTSTQGDAGQTYSLFSGSLPNGLSLNTSTGVVSGTPTTSGASSFTIQANDNYATAGYFFYRQAYAMTINGVASLPLSDTTIQNSEVMINGPVTIR